jgi:outer membrane protein TolC
MRWVVLTWIATAGGAVGLAQTPPPVRVPIAHSGIAPPPAALAAGTPPPATTQAVPEPGEKTYPITLAAALKLAGGRNLDIQIADQQVAIAARQLDRAKLLWVPNLVTGMDYFRHEGGQQNFVGDIVRSSRGSLAVGVGPNAVVSVADAVYAPLAAKQDLRARHALRQAAENDATLAVVEAYFTAQQARGELAGAALALKKADEVAAKAERLAEGLAPPLEASRAKVELARRHQAVAAARERWRTASADLIRLLRLEPGTLVEPVEPPFLPVSVIDPSATVDSLIPVALTNRPELAGQQAVVQATLTRLKQEKARPLIPSVALRSTATNPSGSIAWGGFGGGPNDRMQAFGSRFDLDLQVLWEFESLGFGNRARAGERRAEHQVATLELFRTQDRIAAEVSVAFAQARAASERMTQAEPALREAVELVEKSLLGMGQTKRVGDTNVLIVRPQEVVAAVQAFGQANADFYTAVADYNRAQFRLYRALGHPAEHLAGTVEAKAPAAAAAVPVVTPTGYTDRPRPLPPPKPLDGDERRRPVRLAATRTEVLDIPVMREVLYRRSDRADAAVDWAAAGSTGDTPPGPDAPLPVIPPPPAEPPKPAQEPVVWGKAKNR